MGSSESILVIVPHFWKSHVDADTCISKAIQNVNLNFNRYNHISKFLESVGLELFNMQKVSKVNYIFFGNTLCWNLFHFSKKKTSS